ncbi:MAG: mechanosensitive ion channel [Gemmatimonadetes bacterium]|nr:mechanosensitive ion channel [Gemmatimonadota bacterium]
MDRITDVAVAVWNALNFPLFQLGGTQVTLWTLTYVILLFTLLIVVSGQLKRWVARSLGRVSDVDKSIHQSIATIVRYVVIAVGVIIIVQSAGIDLSALTLLAGAAGVGIGFGLQNIINNFVSGLIILFERPIKIGDRVDVGTVHGDVVNISARSTTIITNDNIAIIVPNSEFISSKVTNWSYQDRKVRFDIPVGVSYSSDLDVVTRLLIEVANHHDGVLATPKPTVLFEEFGDSSLNFTLQVWTRQYATVPRVLRSELNYAIARSFKQNNIEIPFPQRDLHVRSGGLEVRGAAT